MGSLIVYIGFVLILAILLHNRSDAQKAESAGFCEINTNGFFNLPQMSRAMSTGSKTDAGTVLRQDFRDLCNDVTSRKYRTIDGNCNHPKNWGASFKPLARMLPAEYDDGVGTPRRRGSLGTPLPSPRAISRFVHPSTPDPISRTIMIMQWGQWLDHDLSVSPVASGVNNVIQCCGPNGSLPIKPKDPNCFPIILPPDEENFSGKCMEFVRSVPAFDKKNCMLRPREQINVLNSFVDGSQIYGSTDDLAARLRVEGDFLMKTKNDTYLPEDVASACIRRPETNDYCFLAGDIRVNEHASLGALHTIWVRAHNKIAKELRALRPRDSNEEIFQLTRKIIGALQQVITYNEWLPMILGKQATVNKLTSKTGRTQRLPSVDPRILNEFSTAALRFGHSFIPDAFPIGDRLVPLRLLFNRPAEVLDNLDDIVAGLTGVSGGKSAQKIDRNFVAEVTNHLFEPPTGPPGHGLDLISLNIQRGRDHGIPPYTAYRAACGLRPLTGFDDVEALGPNVAQLSRVYRSVDDIDLFTGLVHEPPTPQSNALVGPTLACILGTQFYNLKFGDRFFFDTNDKFIAFTDAQLKSFRSTTFANVICSNTNIEALQNNVFSFTSTNNPLIPCTQLEEEGLNLSLFT